MLSSAADKIFQSIWFRCLHQSPNWVHGAMASTSRKRDRHETSSPGLLADGYPAAAELLCLSGSFSLEDLRSNRSGSKICFFKFFFLKLFGDFMQ